MPTGEIHGDDIADLNTCASDGTAATIMKQKSQEAREDTAGALAAGHRSAPPVRGKVSGPDLRTWQPQIA